MSANMDWAQQAQNAVLFFVPFLFALCFHEFAHGWMARRKGDRTAEIMGRLTLNPTAHADPIGTVVLPLAAVFMHWPLFGWAKPVPVNERNLAHPRQDMFWIALAGPASNMLLALVGTLALFAFLSAQPAVAFERSANGDFAPGLTMALNFIKVNVFLAIFNLLPLHPLDGGKVLARFLPENMNRALEEAQNYTSIILIVLFVSGTFALIMTPAQWIAQALIQFAASGAV